MDAILQQRVVDELLGKPLVSNAFRGLLVEAMLAEVLEPEWTWCSADWASHDFETSDGVKLEVKQSAALQSWHQEGARHNPGRFDIASRKLRWEGAKKIDEAGRYAAIYVFAWHPVVDPQSADHRRPEQWQFFALREVDLPDQATIGRSRIEAMANAVPIQEIAAVVGRIRAS